MLLALLNIGSSAAFGAIIALSSLGLFASYFIAISSMMFARYNKKEPLELGGWNMGRIGPAVNVFALVYTVWVSIFLPFPETLPVTGVNMNYCGPIFVAIFVVAISTWYLYARKNWAGPNAAIVHYVINNDQI